MHHRQPYTYIHFGMERCLIYLQRYCARSIVLLTPLALRALLILVKPFSPIDSQDVSNPVLSSVPGPMPVSMTQYVSRVMWWPNLPVRLIVDISRLIPVYISHIHGRHHLELSGAVPVVTHKGRVQEAVPFHLGDVISYAISV